MAAKRSAIRRTAFSLSLVSILVAACASPPVGPNIVLVVLDTVRRDSVGRSARPGAESLTPAFDAIARGGTLFAGAWANAPWTLPSHASLLTGLLPSEHRCTSAAPRFAANRPTLAEILSEKGYATAAFHSNPWLTGALSGVLRGFDTEEVAPFERPELSGRDQGGARTLAGIARWLDHRDPNRPFFLFVNFLEAHLPYNPDGDFRSRAAGGIGPGDVVGTAEANEWNAGLRRGVKPDWERVRRLYGGDVHLADTMLGRLVALLRDRGLYEEALFVVTSDHGENLGDHGRMDHQFGVEETLLAVPLVIRAPGRLAPGVRSDPVMLIDLFPTLLEAAGVAPAAPRGHARSLFGPPLYGARPLLAEYAGPPGTHMSLLRKINPDLDAASLKRAFATVRRKNLRLTVGSDASFLLHDLAADPAEEADLAPARPGAVDSLAAFLPPLGIFRRPPAAPSPVLADSARTRLRALGYAE